MFVIGTSMDGQPIDLRGVFALLRRQLRLIVFVFLTIMGGALVATLVLKEEYTAYALVLVDPTQKNLLNPDTSSGGASSESTRVDSEVILVKSRDTLLSVVQSEQLIDNPEFGPKLDWQTELLAFLKIRPASLPTGEAALQIVLDNLDAATSVWRWDSTYLISIEATTGDPETSAKVANALANAYVRGQLESKVNAVEASRDMLRSRIAGASGAITASEQAFDRFLADTVDNSGNAALLDLRRQHDQLTADASQLQAVADVAAASRGANDWDAVARSLQSESLSKLEAQRVALEERLNSTAEGSPLAIDLRGRLSALETDLSTAADKGIADLRERVASSQQQAESLQQQLRTALVSSNLPANTLTQIYELQRNTEIARSQYDNLVNRLSDLETQTFLQLPDSRIVTLASPPSYASFPNPRLILTLAGMAALLLGVGLAFVYENFLGGFTSEGQASAVLHLPFASSVPFQRQKLPDKSYSHADLVITAPLSAYSESIRRVRLSAELAAQRAMDAKGGEKRGMIIMVTSANPNEGKTTLSLALSRVFTVSGKRTLLIDADLRNPRLHRHLGIEPSTGLLDYLRRGDNAPQISSILAEDKLGGVAVAIGARTSSSPTDQLVAGETFGRLLAAATRAFDIVILDTPPIGPVVDALYLSRFVDATVFVVKWAATRQSDARRAISALNTAKRPEVEVIGVLQQAQGDDRNVKQYGGGYYTDG
ncbi:GumC family protein [Devosia sp. CN2-171]|uniref:GumC family protein n=1 Tax=Devosia sp. CN2-171 TaxID=3400909 RepID=UPI003BF8BAB2